MIRHHVDRSLGISRRKKLAHDFVLVSVELLQDMAEASTLLRRDPGKRRLHVAREEVRDFVDPLEVDTENVDVVAQELQRHASDRFRMRQDHLHLFEERDLLPAGICEETTEEPVGNFVRGDDQRLEIVHEVFRKCHAFPGRSGHSPDAGDPVGYDDAVHPLRRERDLPTHESDPVA